jgi:hypothetical protein
MRPDTCVAYASATQATAGTDNFLEKAGIRVVYQPPHKGG